MKNHIQELRKKNRVTQEDLAVQCRVTRQTIISLESGKYNPSIFLAYKIARAFGLTIEQVFVFEEEEQ